MIILTSCCLYTYPKDAAKIVNDLTKFMSFEQVNSQWTDVSQMSIESHSMCQIILEFVYNTFDFHSNVLDRRVLFNDHKELQSSTGDDVRQRSQR